MTGIIFFDGDMGRRRVFSEYVNKHITGIVPIPWALFTPNCRQHIECMVNDGAVV